MDSRVLLSAGGLLSAGELSAAGLSAVPVAAALAFDSCARCVPLLDFLRRDRRLRRRRWVPSLAAESAAISAAAASSVGVTVAATATGILRLSSFNARGRQVFCAVTLGVFPRVPSNLLASSACGAGSSCLSGQVSVGAGASARARSDKQPLSLFQYSARSSAIVRSFVVLFCFVLFG